MTAAGRSGRRPALIRRRAGGLSRPGGENHVVAHGEFTAFAGTPQDRAQGVALTFSPRIGTALWLPAGVLLVMIVVGILSHLRRSGTLVPATARPPRHPRHPAPVGETRRPGSPTGRRLIRCS